jgi:N-acetyl-anhydromuramyl-L-alanine amidase AmpD
MPLVHVENRYCSDDPVVGAAVTFDNDPITATSPRTLANGNVNIATSALTDGNHVLRITPAQTSNDSVGPQVAENLPAGVRRMFRSLEVDIAIRKGQITSVSVPAGRQENGAAGAGLNPVMVFLQPIFFHPGDLGVRKPEDVKLIVIHQTAGGSGKTPREVHGTLAHFQSGNGAANYLVTAEPKPQVVKIVPDNHTAGHAGQFPGQTSWGGKIFVDKFSIGIENSHKAKTDWSRAQIDRLIVLLEELLTAYPSIPRRGVVGHADVLLIHRDCPGLEFDWPLLEKQGLGMIPKTGGIAIDSVYGGFFRLQATGQLQGNDHDAKRRWGGKPWAASPTAAVVAGQAVGGVANVVGKSVGGAVRDMVEGLVTGAVTGASPTTVIGNPIKELQTDLRDIGYTVDVNGLFDEKTLFAVTVFQKHFFSGTRRALVADNIRGKVDRVTAEFIKAVRP